MGKFESIDHWATEVSIRRYNSSQKDCRKLICLSFFR